MYATVEKQKKSWKFFSSKFYIENSPARGRRAAGAGEVWPGIGNSLHFTLNFSFFYFFLRPPPAPASRARAKYETALTRKIDYNSIVSIKNSKLIISINYLIIYEWGLWRVVFFGWFCQGGYWRVGICSSMIKSMHSYHEFFNVFAHVLKYPKYSKIGFLLR